MHWRARCLREPMTSPRNSRGGSSGCFIRFLALIIAGFLLISWLPRCAQELPQMAGNAASHAATGAAGAAGNTVGGWGQSLLHGLEKLLGFARDQWDNADPAGKFDLVCEHTQVEGVDKLCPYFTAALQGASDAQAAQTACYWHAAATSPNAQQTLQTINRNCPQTAGDPSRLQSCIAQYVEPGDASGCLASSPQQLWPQLHTMTEPIACIPGLPKSWCTTQPSATTAAPAAAPATRTDANYLNCIQYYYLKLPAYNQQLSCGSSVNAQNAACARSALQAFTYQGQSVGAQQAASCDAQQ
jgi:hypothetical protein